EYAGLNQCIASAPHLPADDTKINAAEVSERVLVDDLATAMVSIDQTFDRLKLLREAGWESDQHHPDLDPANEATILRELFREAARLRSADDDVKRGLE